MHCYLVPIDTPTNWTYLYRALLQQDSIMYYRMHWFLVPMDPPKLSQLVQSHTTLKQYYLLRNAYTPRADGLAIKPTCTEPYYTKTVLPIDKCRDTHGRQTPQPLPNWTQVYWALLHQDSMTLQNADIPSVNVASNQVHLYRALLHQDI